MKLIDQMVQPIATRCSGSITIAQIRSLAAGTKGAIGCKSGNLTTAPSLKMQTVVDDDADGDSCIIRMGCHIDLSASERHGG